MELRCTSDYNVMLDEGSIMAVLLLISLQVTSDDTRPKSYALRDSETT